MNEWEYKGAVYETQPDKSIRGFCYIITHPRTARYYIGQKSVWHEIRRKPLKGKKRIRKDLVPSDWQNYWGSSNKFQEFIEREGKENFKRYIISFHISKSSLSYAELCLQIEHDVLRDENSFNNMLNIRISKIKE